MKLLTFQYRIFFVLLLALLLWAATLYTGQAAAGITPIQCDTQFVEAESYFQKLTDLRKNAPHAIPDEVYKAAALAYISQANACAFAMIEANTPVEQQPYWATGPLKIDDGGISVYGNPQFGPQFNTEFGQKWGANSPYVPNGQDIPGPGTPGGTVTYSYMANGISHGVEGTNRGANVDVGTGLGVNSCVKTEIATAFAAWSAVANIQFTEVADSGTASNSPGATGDIRIGAHAFDGPSGTLAHAFFPPNTGDTFNSITGDLHFDTGETWSCTPSGGVDIGIVALHEIGHSIGFGHEPTKSAVMNPFYDPSITGLKTDDINGAISVYGSTAPTVVKALVAPATITRSVRATYTISIQNNAGELTNTTLTDQLPANTTFAPGSATSNGTIDLTNFPNTTAPFTLMTGQLKVTYALTIGTTVNKGDLLQSTVTLASSGLGSSVVVNHTDIVDAEKVYLPMIIK